VKLKCIVLYAEVSFNRMTSTHCLYHQVRYSSIFFSIYMCVFLEEN